MASSFNGLFASQAAGTILEYNTTSPLHQEIEVTEHGESGSIVDQSHMRRSATYPIDEQTAEKKKGRFIMRNIKSDPSADPTADVDAIGRYLINLRKGRQKAAE